MHASGTSVDYTNRLKSDCQQCHDHQGFLDWVDSGVEDTTQLTTVSAIHCFTCHAPHTRGDLSLRADGPYTLKNGVVFDYGAANLCVRCHHTRTALTADLGTADTVKLTTRFGPHHGPQGDLLQGTHGYQFAGYTYPTASQHGAATTDGCIDCHMGNPQAHDGYNIGGHSFNMRYESHDGTEYTLSGVCTSCHPAAASFDYNLKDVDYNNNGAKEGIQTELLGLRDTLSIWLEAAGALSENATTHAFSIVNNKWVPKPVAGAVYNWVLFNEDRSWGLHNPQYMYHLLKSSVDYMKAHQ